MKKTRKFIMRHFIIKAVILQMCFQSVYGQVSIDVPLIVNEVDTVVNGDLLTRGPDGNIAVKKHQIGDMAYGGIVFYVDPSGVHGLVADTVDLTNGVLWRNQSSIQTNATASNIGAGPMNTLLVTSLQVPEDPDGDFATLRCIRLDRGGYGDWYLPSIEELIILYNNLHLAGLGGFPSPLLSYWSSSEIDKNHAHYFNFSSGIQESGLKDTFFAVRAIRSF